MIAFAQFDTAAGKALVNLSHIVGVQYVGPYTSLLVVSRDGGPTAQETPLAMSYEAAVKAIAEARVRFRS